MARPMKSRRICSHPVCTRFSPHSGLGDPIIMSLDEYEALRLIDLAAMSQEQCAEQMGIARTTVQAIYAEARRKLAECIVNGYPLHITGGSVYLCERRTDFCEQGRCCRCGTGPLEEEKSSNEPI